MLDFVRFLSVSTEMTCMTFPFWCVSVVNYTDFILGMLNQLLMPTMNSLSHILSVEI